MVRTSHYRRRNASITPPARRHRHCRRSIRSRSAYCRSGNFPSPAEIPGRRSAFALVRFCFCLRSTCPPATTLVLNARSAPRRRRISSRRRNYKSPRIGSAIRSPPTSPARTRGMGPTLSFLRSMRPISILKSTAASMFRAIRKSCSKTGSSSRPTIPAARTCRPARTCNSRNCRRTRTLAKHSASSKTSIASR